MPNPTGHTDSIKNSQFKAAWQSGPTRTIRVPIALADITLQYARQLDQGVEPRDTQTDGNNQASNLDESIVTEPRDTSQLGAELEDARANYAALLESSTVVTNNLREEVAKLRSQLATERADREEIEAELADLKQNSAPPSELPEAADLLNRLKAKRKKSAASLADIEAILEMIEKSCDDTSREN